MKILIDIGHPAHVHYYRNLASELISRGINVLWSTKDIYVVKKLLDHYGFSYILLPKKADSLVGKALMQVYYDLKLLQFCKKENIDIALGTSATVTHISKLSSVNSIVFDDDDDEVQPLVTNFVNPFADSLLSPMALSGRRRRKDTIYFSGYMELAYLHPNRFTPDPLVLFENGLEEDEPFFLMRFNVFKAHHDVGNTGLSLKQKIQLTEVLRNYGKVFITTEREIEPELKQYQLSISPQKIHSFMAYSKMLIGDSQTMTSEAAMLGVPSLRCNSFAGRISYLEEQEKRYNLTFSYLPQNFDKLIIKLIDLLSITDIKEEWKLRRSRMLADKIDVTSFMTWFIENYPHSKQIMKINPEIQFNFR